MPTSPSVAQPTLDMELTPKGARALEPVEPDGMMQTLERLARDPNASVEKIERLMALWERSEAKKAETAFNAAMSRAQKAMRPVAADASNPQTRSRYASYAALDNALRPIYTAHDFGLSFDTGEALKSEDVRVLCYVTHGAGHARTYHLDMPADGKGAKGGDVMTKTHATGSAVSYGMRYLLKMIFNVAVGEDDDDGNAAGDSQPEPTPDGYAALVTTLEAAAMQGTAALMASFNQAPVALRTYLATKQGGKWNALKGVAASVPKKGATK